MRSLPNFDVRDRTWGTYTAATDVPAPDPTRLTMLAYLSQVPVTVSDLAAILKVAQPTVSEHLRLLKAAGLVTARRDGTRLYCRTDGDAVQVLLKLVGELTVR